MPIDEDSVNLLQQKFPTTKFLAKELTSKILITIHGICEPGKKSFVVNKFFLAFFVFSGDEIKIQLMTALEHKLNDAVLDLLLVTLERNPNCKLASEDIEVSGKFSTPEPDEVPTEIFSAKIFFQFLQPKSDLPQEIWNFSLPSITIGRLYAVNFYLRQHLQDFLHFPNYSQNSEQFRVRLPIAKRKTLFAY